MKERAYKLMKEWCDTLLSHQIKTNTPYTNNALICPACHVIHGRIADLCFPLTVIWSRTGDNEYLEQADRLIDWTEYNLKTSDGIWYNDAGNRWIGISAFSAMSIGESLYHFGDTLPEKYKTKWTNIFIRMMKTIAELDSRESFRPVSNYYCGIAAALAMAWRLTGNEKYYEKSKYWISSVLERFDENGLLFGEWATAAADDGSHAIDIGYNLEESLPLLLRYTSLTGEYGDLFLERLYAHLEFLLPDGGIDDSFGTRHNKWTYWGSRTSDGLIEGLALMLDRPRLADACERVLSLYEKCTHGGLLAMPMAHEVNEPTCLHHTFAHAKALATLVCAENVPEVKRTTLPSEEDYGIKKFQNGRLILASNGRFRATFSACHAMMLPEYASNGGGSMNLLYHKNYGVICAATSLEYVPSEPLNQQYLRSADTTPCMTAQFKVNGEMCCKEKNVSLTTEGSSITAKGKLWQARYTLSGDSLGIDLSSENGAYELPIVCSKNSNVTLSDDGCTLTVDNKLTVKSDIPMALDCQKRVFNQVGGLLYLPVSVEVNGNVSLVLRVTDK